ncbi:GNAT family N-acetyltransferase [Polycladidibacter stylochi]|uniref:GNAT family N-acetyltransferase n=1 Tax=Polycladidibacter stylochi TaxID=1807766 RepID=UPI0008376AB6|nr:GNAT family N-acetyltransferase [Pseudovibrio stylochi]
MLDLLEKEYVSAPRLETERLILRAHTKDDYLAIHEMWSEEAVYKYISGTPPTMTESWLRLLRYSGHWQLMGFGGFAVELRENGRYIGEVGVSTYKRNMGGDFDQLPEAGWILHPDYHGNGYAFEAMSAVLDFAASKLGFSKSVCMVDDDNAASNRLANRLGYVAYKQATYKDTPVTLYMRT